MPTHPIPNAPRCPTKDRRRTPIELALTQWLEDYRHLSLLLVPVLAFVESCIGIGLFVSGVFLVLVSSAIYAQDIASLEWIMGLALVGAMLGDHTGYYAGRWIGPRLHHLRLAQRHRGKLDKAESLIRVSGPYAVLIGRFVPAVRSVIPAALGISGFQRLRYSVLDTVACLLWTAALGAITAGVAQV